MPSFNLNFKQFNMSFVLVYQYQKTTLKFLRNKHPSFFYQQKQNIQTNKSLTVQVLSFIQYSKSRYIFYEGCCRNRMILDIKSKYQQQIIANKGYFKCVEQMRHLLINYEQFLLLESVAEQWLIKFTQKNFMIQQPYGQYPFGSQPMSFASPNNYWGSQPMSLGPLPVMPMGIAPSAGLPISNTITGYGQGQNLNRYGSPNKRLFVTSTPDYRSPRPSSPDRNVELEYSRREDASRISGSRMESNYIGGILSRSPVKETIVEEGATVSHGGIIHQGHTHGGAIQGGIIQGGVIQGGTIHGGITQGAVVHGQKPQSIRHFQQIPYEACCIGYEQRQFCQQVMVPVQRKKVNYYAIEHITDYEPREYEETITEMVPEERIRQRIYYLPIEQHLVHIPINEKRPPPRPQQNFVQHQQQYFQPSAQQSHQQIVHHQQQFQHQQQPQQLHSQQQEPILQHQQLQQQQSLISNPPHFPAQGPPTMIVNNNSNSEQSNSYIVKNNNVIASEARLEARESANSNNNNNNSNNNNSNSNNNSNNIFHSFGKEEAALPPSAVFPPAYPSVAMSKRTDSDIPSLLNRVSRGDSDQASGVSSAQNEPIRISSLSHQRSNPNDIYQNSNIYKKSSKLPLSEIEESSNIHKQNSYQSSNDYNDHGYNNGNGYNDEA